MTDERLCWFSVKWKRVRFSVRESVCITGVDPPPRFLVQQVPRSCGNGRSAPRRPHAGRGRMESMPKVRKGVRSRRSGRMADLLPGRMSETKADPEELTKAVARAKEVFGDGDAAF